MANERFVGNSERLERLGKEIEMMSKKIQQRAGWEGKKERPKRMREEGLMRKAHVEGGMGKETEDRLVGSIGSQEAENEGLTLGPQEVWGPCMT